MGWNVNRRGTSCAPNDQIRVMPDPQTTDRFTVTQVADGPNAGAFYVDTAVFRMDRVSNTNPQIAAGGTALTLTGSQVTACGATANCSKLNTCKSISMTTLTAAVVGHEGLGYAGGRGYETAGRTAAGKLDNDPYTGIEFMTNDSSENHASFLARHPQ